MNKTARLLFPSLIALAVAAASAAAEEVRPLEFIHALQEKGYQDIAVEYLTALLDRQEKGQGTMPEEVADVFDLEMAKSMRGAAGRAYNAKDASQLIASAQEHLNKFLKEKPNHPEAENALVSFAGFIMDDALKNLRSAKAATDKAEKAKLSAAARAGTEEARSKFRTAADKVMVRIKALPPLPAAPKAGRPLPQYVKALKVRRKLNYLYFTALFQAGLCDYYLAQTFADGSDPGRAASLKNAANMFNFVYQYNRIDEVTGRVNPIGLQAHMWEGKSREELGDWETAVDIYDECLANAPDANDKSPPNKAFEPLFAQVQEFRMGILLKQKPEQFFKEAPDWLDAYTARWKLYDGFQGVALKLAKAYLKDPSKAKEGRGILEAMSRVPSSSQQEAYELLKGPGSGKAGKLEDAKTFEEAVAAGDSALKEKKWAQAVKAYRTALKMAGAKKGKKGAPSAERLAKVHETLAAVEYEIALELFQAGKCAESLELCSRIIEEEKTAPVTPSAGLLAVHSQMGIYTAVPATEKEKKKTARETLEKIAKFTIDTWPNKPEADDTRMVLAQEALNRGDAEGALKILGEINPKSERYGVSLAISGQLLWELYVKTKKPFLEMGNKPDATAQAAMDSLRKRAREKMSAAVAKLMEAIAPGKPPSPQCLAAQLLYAEILLEEGSFKEAVTVLEPLVAANKPDKPGALEMTTVRIFLDALRGHLGMGNVQKAGEIGKILVDGGEDNPTVNQVLVDFCRTLDKERKKAEADRIRANSQVDAKGVAEAGKRLGEYESLMGELLKRISDRRQFTPSAMRYVIELCTEVSLIDQAAKLCQDLQEKAEHDPNFAKYKSWVLSQKIGVSRKAGKFEEAAAAAEKLVEENPKALDPRMELGRIYEDWAQRDPGKFDEAAKRWAQVRNLLDPAKRRKEFAEPYYEANYHASLCMFQQAKQLLPTDKKAAVDKAMEGGKFLTASLIQAPKLSGPDMVTRYKALREEIKTFGAKNKVE